MFKKNSQNFLQVLCTHQAHFVVSVFGKILSLLIPIKKINPLLWSHHAPRDHDMNNLNLSYLNKEAHSSLQLYR